MIQRDAFHAISDPTRRRILASIAHNPLNVTTITEQFDVTRAAIYKHIKILEESGLLEITPNGRERFCAANLRKLSEVADWIEPYREFWSHSYHPLEKGRKGSDRDKPDKKKKKHGKKKRKHHD